MIDYPNLSLNIFLWQVFCKNACGITEIHWNPKKTAVHKLLHIFTMFGYTCTCATEPLRRAEDNFRESALSFHPGGSEAQTRLSDLVASPFTHWATSLEFRNISRGAIVMAQQLRATTALPEDCIWASAHRQQVAHNYLKLNGRWIWHVWPLRWHLHFAHAPPHACTCAHTCTQT